MKDRHQECDDSQIPVDKRAKIIFEKTEKQFKRRNEQNGISCGLGKIDSLTGKLHFGDLIIFAGFPGNLKTSISLQICSHLIFEHSISSLLANGTFSKKQMVRRLLCFTGKISLGRMLTGNLKDRDWPRLTMGVGLLGIEELKTYYYNFDRFVLTKKDIKKLETVIKEKHIELLVLDPLPKPIESSNYTIKMLKEFAVEQKIILIAVIDLLPHRPDAFVPEFSDLINYLEIEDYADVIILLNKRGYNMGKFEQRIDCLEATNGSLSERVYFHHDTYEFVDTKNYGLNNL